MVQQSQPAGSFFSSNVLLCLCVNLRVAGAQVQHGDKKLLATTVTSMNRTMTLKIWLTDWITNVTHNPPNAVKPSMPHVASASLYEQYTVWCKAVNEVPLSNDSFRPEYVAARKELGVRMRASKQGSKEDPISSTIKRLMAQAVRQSEKKWIAKVHANFYRKKS